jgi:PAS domain S-box-containing protein
MIHFMRFLREKLSHQLTRLIVWSVLPIGLTVTLALIAYIKASADRLAERDFVAECTEVQRILESRLDDHARILLSGAALFNVSDAVTREEWRIFAQSLKVEKQLPGVQGFGFSLVIPRSELSQHIQKIRSEGFQEYQVRPEGEREVYSSIIFLEPFSGRNLRAFGYDMFSEPVRRAAMERARDTDAAALSGKVVLVQETDQEVQAGTLMYVPVYRKGLPTATVEQRRAAIIGWVYSPYRMNDLLQGILGVEALHQTPQRFLAIYDDARPSPQSLLFGHTPVGQNIRFKRQTPILFNGHRWTLCFAQSNGGLFTASYQGVWSIFIGGILSTLLLFAFFSVLLDIQSDAQQLAKTMTTDLLKSEESFRQVTERLSLAARAGGVGIWDYDVVNNRLVWDDQMFRLYGITRDQFCGAYEAWQAGLHPEDRQRGDERIQLALQGEKEFDLEFRVLWPGGTIRYIRGFAMVQRDDAGKPLRMIGTNWDITEITLAGENIKLQASLISSLLDSMPDIVFFKDVEGRYLGCNPHFARYVGRTKEEIVGKTDYDLVDKAVADAFRVNDRRMLELNESRHNEEWITYPDGRKILIDTLKTPYWGPSGELIGILGISRDITAQHQAELSLRESEANFRTFFESMTDMIMVATTDGRIILTNTAVSKTLGYAAEELKGMLLLELHPEEVRQEAGNTVAAMFRGERESCPLPLARKDGVLVPVETRIWLGQWNGMNCLFGICKDLTAEQEAKQRFERLFHSNPCAIALSSLPDRRFLDVNSAFLKALGYSREEVIGNTSSMLQLFVHPEQQAVLAEKLTVDGHIADVELQLRCKDGKILDGLFSGEAFVSQGKRYLMTVMVDITARKRSEAELARVSTIQHALMLLATDFVNVPLEQQDRAIRQSLETIGRLIHADRAYLFEYDFEHGVMSNTHEWCEEGVSPEIGNLQAVPIMFAPDWVVAHQRGEEIHVPDVALLPSDSNLRKILEPQGIHSLVTLPLIQGDACLGFVGFDAVREKRVWREEEVALLQALAELYAHFEARLAAERETRELQKRLTQARDAAQEAVRAKSLFLGNMSHEIRTPLNAILGYAQIMGRECLARACPMVNKLGAITRSGEHLLVLLTDLLELVRSDSNELTLSISPFDFYQALEDVRLIFAKNLASQSLKMDVSCASNVPQFICSDSGKVRQILLNLLGNALKFTENGSVRLSIAVLPGEVADGITIAVDVEDTGCGIRPEEVKHLFELFYTHADQRHKAARGTGLGLPLSQRYARVLGGDIVLTRSTPGEGSCFRFTFRTHVTDSASVEQKQKGVVSRLAPDQPPCRILVVDDDPANREMLSDMLEAVGVVVETASSAAIALHRLRQHEELDLVLMDKRMPEMDGYEAIRHMRAIPGCEKLSVFVVTASGLANEHELALAAGADGYISKPIHREKLLEEIGRVTGIQYEYEPSSSGISVENEFPVLDAEALLRLPAEIRYLIKQALKRGDIHQLRDLVETIALDQIGIANGIRILVNAYDYGRLRNLIESAERTPG